MIRSLIAAAIGTIAFSLIFSVPTKYYIRCGLTGAAGWFVYLIFEAHGLSETMSIFFGTLVVVLMSRRFAIRCQCPVTVFLLAGIIPLVPGAGVYWTAYYLVTNQIDKAADRGFFALKAVIAIVTAIVIIFEIPQKYFKIGLRTKRS